MDLFGDTFKDEQTFEINIQQDPNSIQRRQTNLFSTKRESDRFGSNYRRSKDYTEHICGRSLLILHDQSQTSTTKTAISRGSDKISFPTSATIDKMDKAFGDKTKSTSTSRIFLTSNCDQCNVKVHLTEDHQVLVRSDINRHHSEQTEISLSSTEPRPNEPESSPTRQGNECCAPGNVMGTRQLCQDEPINTLSELEKRITNQTSFNPYNNGTDNATLRKLSHNLELQYSHDIPSLLCILTSLYPFKAFKETNSICLYDHEIEDFLKLYGVSNVRPILASADGYVFWLQNNAGTIYIWSHAEGCMSYAGKDLREALINYLFHQDNVCYVIEFTREIIPRNEVKQKAKEFAESCEIITLEVTNKPLKGDGKRKKKKKKKKKKGQK